MAYTKTQVWYISQELKPVAKKMQAWINKRGSPKVKVRVSAKQKPVFWIDAPLYAKFQDKGVKGIKGGKSLSGYKYGKRGAPPAAAFERYTSNTSEQFAIAQSIYQKGFKAKKYIGKGIGHFAPQITAAIKRGGTKYIKTEIMPESGTHKIK